ncbi:hypothetical protein ADL03_16005 [Nocardia sp. NRRL S-836]|nr:hypothetical protein ADL03_16005 [Nocardia sp. NRRL S-836]
MPPAVAAYAIAAANEVKFNKQHRYCDPRQCQRSRRMHDDYLCIHGTFLGDPYGPDHMCPYCESGDSPYAYGLDKAWKEQGDIVSHLITELVRAKRRAVIAHAACLISARDVYAKPAGDLIERPTWEWFTPENGSDMASLIAALTTPLPQPAPAR